MYGKIFSKMYEGSMVGIGPDVFALWGYCIAKADPDDHTVELNPTLLSCIIGMPVQRVKKALSTLLAADPDSHSQEAGGARLTHDTGHRYHVTTHEEYRGINDHDAMKAYMRDAKRKQRAKKAESLGKQGELDLVKDSQRQSKNPVSVSVSVSGKEGESEREEKFDIFWRKYPNKQGKAAARKDWKKMKLDAKFHEIMDALIAFMECEQWTKDNGDYIPHGSTWIHQQRWEDVPKSTKAKPTTRKQLPPRQVKS
jgi:hypothetical protein